MVNWGKGGVSAPFQPTEKGAKRVHSVYAGLLLYYQSKRMFCVKQMGNRASQPHMGTQLPKEEEQMTRLLSEINRFLFMEWSKKAPERGLLSDMACYGLNL